MCVEATAGASPAPPAEGSRFPASTTDSRVVTVRDVLVVNAGSTSLKLSVVGSDDSSEPVEALAAVPAGIAAVAHRVVHGGERLARGNPWFPHGPPPSERPRLFLRWRSRR